MNRYPIWKYVLIGIALVASLLYAVPNIYGDSPAVQVSAAHSSTPVTTQTVDTIQKLLADNKIAVTGIKFDGKSVRVKLHDAESQPRARELIQSTLGDSYVAALTLLSNTPPWMESAGAKPMALGLDLLGGVHFMFEVDMDGALKKTLDSVASDVRHGLREEKIRYASDAVRVIGQTVEVRLRDAESIAAARHVFAKELPNMQIGNRDDVTLVLSYTPQALQKLQADAIAQNLGALHNRVNALGVAEPLIQQQGANRIVVELPGVQDPAQAIKIIGSTASLEVRMSEHDQSMMAAALAGNIPTGYDLLDVIGSRADKLGAKVLVKREVELTGNDITKADAAFDSQTNEPIISMGLNSHGASIFRQLTHDNIGKNMAIVLVENGVGKVITDPTIRGELGSNFQISGGGMTTEEANDIAILVKSGALAAPMNLVEERTIGPSLGKENILKGRQSVIYGFIAITLFMAFYYRVFGLTAAVALAVNLLFLVACLSLLGVTMTLPGIAAIALTLGMAIDSNVLINERIREEVRGGMPPQSAISAGYEHAFATILDSNITTLIAGLALLIFGSGAVRGFAWVHCLGIATSMFSSVFVSRGVVNLIYGYRRKVKSLAV
ncbi:MAG: protein translocase subunit SecD [Burkholderiales bacterium]|nr:protein translocase subunit SecD [Burkholderiales bacterium]